MMNLVPPVGWGEVATKRDLAFLGQSLRSEMAVLGADLRGEMAGLRTEMAHPRGEMRAEMADLRGEMHREIGGLHQEFSGLLRTLLFAMVASNATLVGLVFAAVRLA